MYKPYPRQQEAIDKMVAFVESKTTKKGLFVYPTSFGKSVVIANVASKFPDKYFINLVPKKELLEQNYEKYTSYGYEGSICSASLGSNDIGKVTFATIGTLKKHIDFFKDKEVVILSDEAQNGSLKGSQLDKFVNGIKSCKLVGTTATPLRLKPGMGGSELKMMNRMRDCIFTSIEDVVQIQEVVEEGKWTKLLYDVEDMDESALQLNTTGTDYTLKSLKLFSEKNDIVSKCEAAVKKLLSEGRTSIIVYTSFIEEAEALQQRLNNCMALHSKMDKNLRDLTVKEFKEGNLQVVANVGILIEGFDKPDLSAIVMARPTNSITIYYQSIGRLVRLHPDKKNAKVVDLSGNFNKFGKVEDINFEDSKFWGGWNAFSGDKLLTNYPLGSKMVPTKQSLEESWKRNQDYKNRLKQKADPVFNFGMFKGSKLSEVRKDKRGKNYLAWLMEQKDWKWYGEAGKALQRAIKEELKLV